MSVNSLNLDNTSIARAMFEAICDLAQDGTFIDDEDSEDATRCLNVMREILSKKALEATAPEGSSNSQASQSQSSGSHVKPYIKFRGELITYRHVDDTWTLSVGNLSNISIGHGK
jgi:hypothetical protein